MSHERLIACLNSLVTDHRLGWQERNAVAWAIAKLTNYERLREEIRDGNVHSAITWH